MRGQRLTFWILYLPPLVWLGAFLLAPLALMAAFSFRADVRGVHRAGLRFVSMARRHERLLRDFLMDRRLRALALEPARWSDWLRAVLRR